MSRTIKRKQYAGYGFYGNIHQYRDYAEGRALHWAHVKCTWEDDYSNFEAFAKKDYESYVKARYVWKSHKTDNYHRPKHYFRNQTVRVDRVYTRQQLNKVIRLEGYEPEVRSAKKKAGYWN